jgi:rhodanese-related sulfurtransferase
MLIGDTFMFLMGRLTGWWLLGILCRLSLNPESCIFRSAAAFHKRGRLLLVFAKFVPGINTLAPPMAGSMNMRPFAFLRWDLLGATLYICAYMALGFLASDALRVVIVGYRAFNRVMGWALFAGLVVYVVLHVWFWVRSKPLRYAPTIEPEDAAAGLAAGDAVVYDVRSHGYYDAKTVRIPGSRRLDPNTFPEWRDELPRGLHIYLYCTCIREATSARLALVLLEQGIPCLVIRGGLRRWKKLALPLEVIPSEEISALPIFG